MYYILSIGPGPARQVKMRHVRLRYSLATIGRNRMEIDMSIRSDLPPMPPRIASLPIDKDKGYPIPFFVSIIDGKPDFRIMDPKKLVQCVKQKKCWICGDYLGKRLAFVVGPMCCVNMVSSEPASHRDCAEYAVIACPFLSKPYMRRRDNNMPDEATSAGTMIERNPGVIMIWLTTGYKLFNDGSGGVLFKLNDPFELDSYCEGRRATAEEVKNGFDTGLPFLQKMATTPDETIELDKLIESARILLKM